MPFRHASLQSAAPWPRLPLAMFAALMVSSLPAAAQEWTMEPGTAIARLPPPTRSDGVSAAELACAERRWRLVLALEPGRVLDEGARRATIVVGALEFDAPAREAASGVEIAVAGEVIEPLKGGSRLSLDIVDAVPPLSAVFSLRGSRRAIEAAEPECSPRDMSAFESVTFSEDDPAVPLAAELRRDEIAVFRKATASEPRVAAAIVDAGDDRRLLFVRICGSSWYYGRSGCNLAGLAREADDDDWAPVYDTEGVELYLDHEAGTDGWPNLVTLPMTGGGDELFWTWRGERYELREPPGDLAESEGQ